MELIYVDSSSIDQIGYDDTGEVHVLFKNGGHYIYSEVSPEVWEQFRHASSHGTFLNQEFKAKGYPFRKM